MGMTQENTDIVFLPPGNRDFSDVCRVFETLPQCLRNVRFGSGAPLDEKLVQQAIAEGESALGAGGHLVIRKSGTEPVIRVMAQGDDESLVGSVVAEIVGAIEQVAGR